MSPVRVSLDSFDQETFRRLVQGTILVCDSVTWDCLRWRVDLTEIVSLQEHRALGVVCVQDGYDIHAAEDIVLRVARLRLLFPSASLTLVVAGSLGSWIPFVETLLLECHRIGILPFEDGVDDVSFFVRVLTSSDILLHSQTLEVDSYKTFCSRCTVALTAGVRDFVLDKDILRVDYCPLVCHRVFSRSYSFPLPLSGQSGRCTSETISLFPSDALDAFHVVSDKLDFSQIPASNPFKEYLCIWGNAIANFLAQEHLNCRLFSAGTSASILGRGLLESLDSTEYRKDEECCVLILDRKLDLVASFLESSRVDVLHLQSFFSNKHISSQPHPRELLTLGESFIEDGECADSISAADIAVAYGISIDDEERKMNLKDFLQLRHDKNTDRSSMTDQKNPSIWQHLNCLVKDDSSTNPTLVSFCEYVVRSLSNGEDSLSLVCGYFERVFSISNDEISSLTFLRALCIFASFYGSNLVEHLENILDCVRNDLDIEERGERIEAFLHSVILRITRTWSRDSTTVFCPEGFPESVSYFSIADLLLRIASARDIVPKLDSFLVCDRNLTLDGNLEDYNYGSLLCNLLLNIASGSVDLDSLLVDISSTTGSVVTQAFSSWFSSRRSSQIDKADAFCIILVGDASPFEIAWIERIGSFYETQFGKRLLFFSTGISGPREAFYRFLVSSLR